MLKKLKSIAVIGLAGALLLSGCGSSEKANKEDSGGEKEKTYKIGITQIVDHPSLNAATQGFKKAIEESGLKVKYTEQNAQGEKTNAATIANNFVGDNVDLIFANSTDSAQSALNATKDIPIVFTSVTDPVGAQLVASMEKPGGNVTGTSDFYEDSIPNTIEFVSNYMDAKTIGTVYNTGEQNSVAQIEEMKKAIEGTGLKLVESAAATSAEVKTATEALVGKADVIFIITDNTVVSALESVIQVANDNDIPLFVGEEQSVEKGGFAAFAISYEDIGYQAGKMAVQILKGEKTPAEIPALAPEGADLVINKKAAEEMNIEIKDEWKDARFIE
jgi:putative ABC transport system substrate-binding protein